MKLNIVNYITAILVQITMYLCLLASGYGIIVALVVPTLVVSVLATLFFPVLSVRVETKEPKKDE